MLRTRARFVLAAAVAALILGAGASRTLYASGSEPKRTTPTPAANAAPYDQGISALQKSDYGAAAGFFQQAVQAKQDDADAYNMLAYSQRKSGHLQEAFANYAKALQLRPNFPQAREYLGEAHVQAAVAELEALTSSGADGAKLSKQLIYALQQAAAKYPAVTEAEAKAAGGLRY